MNKMEIGSVCIKTKGRKAGSTVVVLSKTEKGKVLVDGPKVKRKECNVLHLFPIGKEVKIKEGAGHEEVVKALKAVF
ncbi:MAG: 50S ribosomal protein L14e [Candidatus Diapherotrites archaeon]|nr:50S ribosomal protein L14e [Candidatus Diapherotrites archaeon]